MVEKLNFSVFDLKKGKYYYYIIIIWNSFVEFDLGKFYWFV